VSHLGQRLSALIDGELSHQQRERVLAHLANCEPCRREAAALRMLKQRMHALGEATADTALTDRLIAVAGRDRPARWGRRLPLIHRHSVPGVPRRRWPVRSLAVASLALAGLGVPAAAFLAGGGQQEPGPSVTPAIDVFMLQHEISTGNAPVQAPAPSARQPGGSPRSAAPVSAAAPGASAAPSSPGAWSVGVTSALTRVAAVSSRVAAAATGVTATSGANRGPHSVSTAAGAR
jgi:Putative zinc-finger